MRTRIAPTPSGYLHAGNAVNALLVDALAREREGRILLRIDDMDAPRYRPEYVEDLFAVLAWLGVAWQDGPRDRADFESRHRLADRTAAYRARLGQLQDAGLATFACDCSRSRAQAAGSRGCVADCRTAARPLEAGSTALRAAIPAGTVVHVGPVAVDLRAEFGDPVLWRRDDLPAYHLASLDEDLRSGVTDIVRGTDLLPSSALQAWLAGHLPGRGLRDVTFWHHDLVRAPDGRKLSKSQLGADPLRRTREERERLRALARDTRARLVAHRVTG